jgi:DNA-binding MarR family transcriptional regulator
MQDQRLEHLYIFLMDQVVKRYHQVASQSLRKNKAGITVDQWVVLKQISENDGAYQSEIAASTVKDAPTTGRIIDQLIIKKLINKQLDSTDRRKYRLHITPEGRKLIERLLPVVLAYRGLALQGLPEAEVEVLITTLHRMLQNLK